MEDFFLELRKSASFRVNKVAFEEALGSADVVKIEVLHRLRANDKVLVQKIILEAHFEYDHHFIIFCEFFEQRFEETEFQFIPFFQFKNND